MNAAARGETSLRGAVDQLDLLFDLYRDAAADLAAGLQEIEGLGDVCEAAADAANAADYQLSAALDEVERQLEWIYTAVIFREGSDAAEEAAEAAEEEAFDASPA